MKKFFIFLIWATHLTIVSAQWNIETVKDHSLKGKVKSCRTKGYMIISDTITTTNKLLEFNSNGQLTLNIDYDKNNTVTCKFKYLYNDTLLKKVISTYYGPPAENQLKGPTKKQITKYTYKYTQNSLIIYSGKYTLYKYYYDEKHRLIQDVKFEYNMAVDTANYFYDEQNRIIKSKVSSKEYDKYEVIYKYDSLGNHEEIIYDDYENYSSVFSYNSNNLQTGYYQYRDSISTNTLEMKLTMIYNERGDCVEDIEYVKNENKIVSFFHSYTYDKNGNWVECITTGGVKSFDERIIIYYPNN